MKRATITTTVILAAICVLANDVCAQLSPWHLEVLSKKFSNLERILKKHDGVLIDDKIVYLAIDGKGKRIEGTSFPTVLPESKKYRYAILIVDRIENAKEFKFKIDGKEYNPSNSLSIFVPEDRSGELGIAQDSLALTILSSDTSDVFSEKVGFEVVRGEDQIFSWEIELTGERSYHVAIMAGYFHSSLNNPTNLTSFVLNNGVDSTLIGDFTEHQRKLSVMAVFYPWQRSEDYYWSKLKWYEYLSVGFGFGLDEDLFDDLFLGLNLEFAKGGYLSAGIHCGRHNVLANNPDFNYGNDLWNRPFDNSLIKEEWDVGYYLGVVIDLRVVSSLIGTRDRLNKKEE